MKRNYRKINLKFERTTDKALLRYVLCPSSKAEAEYIERLKRCSISKTIKKVVLQELYNTGSVREADRVMQTYTGVNIGDYMRVQSSTHSKPHRIRLTEEESRIVLDSML